MDHRALLELAKELGFSAALLPTDQVPVDGKFRAFCEENRCGNYGANYSCPPDCGTVESLHRKLLAEDHALVVQSLWNIDGYDEASTREARNGHNSAILTLLARLREQGLEGFALGYSGCPLCTPCKRKEGLPCAFPELRMGCLSAYCVDVAELSSRCGLEFAWNPGKLYLFGLVAFHQREECAR